MAKYDEQFKLEVVRLYLDEQSGYKTVANKHGLSHGMVRRWVKWFEAYGADAFKKKFTHYSAEFKLSVLQHLWDNELSYGQVAVQFDIRSPGALGIWERSYRMGGLNGFSLELAANRANGKADGHTLSYGNSHVSAGSTVTLQSGGDTTIKGGVVSGAGVVANVGGEALIALLCMQQQGR